MKQIHRAVNIYTHLSLVMTSPYVVNFLQDFSSSPLSTDLELFAITALQGAVIGQRGINIQISQIVPAAMF